MFSSLRSFVTGEKHKAPEKKPLTTEDLRNTRTSALLFVNIDDTGALKLTKEVEALVKDDAVLRAYVEAVVRTIPDKDDPTLLSDFHYEYKNGKLVNVTTGKPFHWVNQAHYDALGDIIVRHIQELMMKDYDLQEVLLPLKQRFAPIAQSEEKEKKPYNGPYNNIFVTKDWQTCEKLMLLIQGSGAVRAGQWARALCINESLELGTILPYLERCKKLGYGVVVFNPNLNQGSTEPRKILRTTFLSNEKSSAKQPPSKPIKHNSHPHKHDLYVWDNLVRVAKAKVIAAVAHSAGGDGAVGLVRARGDEVEARLCGIAFTDSVHGVYKRDEEHVKHFVQKRCRNWVRSKEPLDTKVRKPDCDCLQVSAGHDKHEYTSGVAIDSVFKFLVEREQKFLAGEDPNDTDYDRMDSEEKSDDDSSELVKPLKEKREKNDTKDNDAVDEAKTDTKEEEKNKGEKKGDEKQ